MELIVTPPSGLPQRASIVLFVCEGYDKVEAVSESGLVCTTPKVFLCLCLFSSLLPLLVIGVDAAIQQGVKVNILGV